MDIEEKRRKNREQMRRWRANNPTKALEHSRKTRQNVRRWRANNPEKQREHNRKYDRNNRERRREKHFRLTYGITLAERDAMLAAQGGVCAVCRCTEPGTIIGWHVDHCHATGKIRGILCHHCNVALGAAKDDPARLRALADYVEKHNG